MKLIAFSLVTVMMSSFAQANILEVTACDSQSKTHQLRISNVPAGLELRFEELQEEDFGKVGNTGFKTTGKSVSIRTIHGLTVAELVARKNILSESLVSIMRSRMEFDGDADMHYAYAQEYIQNMNCK